VFGREPRLAPGFFFLLRYALCRGRAMKKQIPFGDDNKRGKGNNRDNDKAIA
jgi:hypothetical protein